MSTPVGRHRARRQAALRRPAVAATATLSALAVSAAGYASATEHGASSAAGNLSGTDGLAPASSSQQYQSFDRNTSSSLQQRASRARTAASARERALLAKRAADAKIKQTSASKASIGVLRQMVTDRTGKAQDLLPARVKETTPDDRASRSKRDEPVPTGGSPKAIARAMLSSYGWSSSQFGCLDNLWTKESGWRVSATNGSSGAYGIPQALPGRKMASIGSDWRTNAATQIKWGLGYIQDRYGSPCSAWSHSVATNWY
ncbi:hypothetical protein [Luteipulveratus mongoliensis]|uniref:Transglycosylase SLT domain-containing protein n=1 Tax=Luteipulveratus mongoliensis TaxID=571913 RepID=A0A0K1JH10_9MICO|nr:hypothetical protein [Luteipulveratus mongoliensis]AKU16007.1 hypothetical protein VV02_09310 [Luteipulveratus mongoliensis]